MFGFQLLDIHPDIVCLGANLGNGYPIGAAIFCDRFAEQTRQLNEANLSSCAAAIATLNSIVNDNLMRKSEQLGNFLKTRLNEVLSGHYLVKNIRGLGLMIEIEVAEPEVAFEIHNRCCERGLITGTGSARRNILRLTPPLTYNGNMAELTGKILGEIIKSL
jgi:4-aminobutyrate aminotransferase-like enzyme